MSIPEELKQPISEQPEPMGMLAVLAEIRRRFDAEIARYNLPVPVLAELPVNGFSNAETLRRAGPGGEARESIMDEAYSTKDSRGGQAFPTYGLELAPPVFDPSLYEEEKE